MSVTITQSNKGRSNHVAFSGRIDESADFSQVNLKDIDDITFDFHGVQLINSMGIHSWVNFLQSIPTEIDISFDRCPPIIVNQINIFAGFTLNGRVKIKSVYAPYYCERCDLGKNEVIDLSSDLKTAIDRKCDKENCELELDDHEAAYFRFLEP